MPGISGCALADVLVHSAAAIITQPESTRKHKLLMGIDDPVWSPKDAYQWQVRRRARYSPELVNDMANTVALTWLPGNRLDDFGWYTGDNGSLEPIVNIRYPRMVVVYRFPEANGPCSGIAVAGYKVTVGRDGRVHYGGAPNSEFMKNFALTPRLRAGGAAVDFARQQVLFKTAIEMDAAMELAAEGLIETVEQFRLPPVLFAFPRNYEPRPEATALMREQLVKIFTPGEPSLNRFVCGKASIVRSVTDSPGGMRTIFLESCGKMEQCVAPRWTIVPEYVKTDGVIKEGALLAIIPQHDDATIGSIRCLIGDGIEWVQRALLEEATTTLTVKDQTMRKGVEYTEEITSKCVPAGYVPGQANRCVMKYLDFRGFLGRGFPGVKTLEPWAAEIQVKKLESPPSAHHGLTAAGPDNIWTFDAASVAPEFGWIREQRDGTW